MSTLTKENSAVIGSDKVAGTDVYDRSGKHIGSIEKVMIEKVGGKVSYAVLSFGGFFGIGDDHYPLPWEKLQYDESLGGYRVDVTKEQVEGAPKYKSGSDYDWKPSTQAQLYGHYGQPPYWR
ncbi:MAG: PRC-barrel domain-containing protein [Hoeflea sp.]|nr:PRC-barrel domain-containing protein [Hoeflea sp.]MDZ7600254.1 PRC-barrel domain-containing protein [Hoeflea sp.]